MVHVELNCSRSRLNRTYMYCRKLFYCKFLRKKTGMHSHLHFEIDTLENSGGVVINVNSHIIQYLQKTLVVPTKIAVIMFYLCVYERYKYERYSN